MDKLRALIHKMTPTTGTFVVAEISEKILTAAEEQLNGELAAMQRDLVLRVIAKKYCLQVLFTPVYPELTRTRSLTRQGNGTIV